MLIYKNLKAKLKIRNTFSLQIAFLIFSLLISKLCWANYTNPPLYYMSYQEIGYADYIKKSDIENSLQLMMDQTYGIGFVDMGDISDLMHGHMLLAPNEKNHSLEKKPIAILYHSQEYEHVREGKPYATKCGKLNSYDRNWIHFLKDMGPYKKGDLIDANEIRKKRFTERQFTVHSTKLDREIVGQEMIEGESFYYFRTKCGSTKNLDYFKTDNLVNIHNNYTQDNVCLALVSISCRNLSKKHFCKTLIPLPNYPFERGLDQMPNTSFQMVSAQ